MLENTLMVAVGAGAVYFGFLLRGYFGSYVSEKGRNLATKEDVARITTEIESVRASIQALAKLQTDYEQQRREWLLAFYDSSVEMLYEKLGARFGDMPIDQGQSLFQFQQSFGALVSSLVKRYQRIVLYFQHEHPLREQAEKTLNEALEAQTIFRRRFGSIKIAFLEEDAAQKSGSRKSVEAAVEATNLANKDYWDDIRPVVERFRSALNQYLVHLNQFLRGDENIRSGNPQKNRNAN